MKCPRGPLKNAHRPDSMLLFEGEEGPADVAAAGRGQLEFFVRGSLRDLVPDDHVLARIDRVLDRSRLHDEVAEVCAPGVGRPAIDPEGEAGKCYDPADRRPAERSAHAG
jgi:hypothetical protein